MAVSHGGWVHPARPTQRAEHGDPQRDIRVRLHRHEVQHGAAIAQRVPGLQRTGREETKGNIPLSGHGAATSTQGAVTSPRHGPGMACHEPERGPLPRAKLLAQRRGTHRCWGRGRDCGRQLYGTSRARGYFSGTSRNDQCGHPKPQCSFLGPSQPWAHIRLSAKPCVVPPTSAQTP